MKSNGGLRRAGLRPAPTRGAAPGPCKGFALDPWIDRVARGQGLIFEDWNCIEGRRGSVLRTANVPLHLLTAGATLGFLVGISFDGAACSRRRNGHARSLRPVRQLVGNRHACSGCLDKGLHASGERNAPCRGGIHAARQLSADAVCSIRPNNTDEEHEGGIYPAPTIIQGMPLPHIYLFQRNGTGMPVPYDQFDNS